MEKEEKKALTGFGQVVIGPPASGKTTYCAGIQQFLQALKRNVAVINLDPDNLYIPYDCAINIRELIELEDIMEKTELGPNGSFIYAMEFLEKNTDWLLSKLQSLKDVNYFIFDCPGQVELYTHHHSLKNIIAQLTKWNIRLTAVHLVDSIVCVEPSNYISALLLSLSTMLQLELPHINVLTKIDLIGQYGPLAFNLDFYTDVMDLSYLQQYLNKHSSKKFKKLNKVLCELIQDFSLIAFHPLNIEDKESVYNVLKAIDKSNGYAFGEGNESLFTVASGETNWEYFKAAEVQEKYVKDEGWILD